MLSDRWDAWLRRGRCSPMGTLGSALALLLLVAFVSAGNEVSLFIVSWFGCTRSPRLAAVSVPLFIALLSVASMPRLLALRREGWTSSRAALVGSCPSSLRCRLLGPASRCAPRCPSALRSRGTLAPCSVPTRHRRRRLRLSRLARCPHRSRPRRFALPYRVSVPRRALVDAGRCSSTPPVTSLPPYALPYRSATPIVGWARLLRFLPPRVVSTLRFAPPYARSAHTGNETVMSR